MSRFLNSLSRVLAAGVPLLAQAPALEPVLRAELAFARLADQKGIRTAFLTWMTDDARVFTPRMTSAKEHYGREPGDPGHLVWYPEAMGIAASGDLAWSLGPWTYAARKGEPVLVHGHFLSLWRRQPDGRWKVEADIGTPHPPPEGSIEPYAAWDTPAGRKPVAAAPDATPALRRLEAELAGAWAEKGGTALLPLLAKGARILRRGFLPMGQTAEITRALGDDRPGTRWEPAQIQVSRAGDLAWTCGETGPDDRGATASFLRIWVLESGAWRVNFDVRVPHQAGSK